MSKEKKSLNDRLREHPHIIMDNQISTLDSIRNENEKLKDEIKKLKRSNNELRDKNHKLREMKNKWEEYYLNSESSQKNLVKNLLTNIKNNVNTIPIGTEVKIVDTDEDKPMTKGKITDETKKFYVIDGKRYHKEGLEFYDVRNGVVYLEDTKW
tara:strand:- start:296 stop:757 length:462 start_codon:yes stop_codon:yes gene_type:complete